MSSSMIESENLLSLNSVALFCLHFYWAITILDLYSVLVQSMVHFFFGAWKYWDEQGSKNATCKLQAPKPSCCDEFANNERVLLEGEVKTVMARLGILCEGEGGTIQEPLEVATMFDEIEPSTEEVKEAFDVFDANKDGYIDVIELQKVLCALGSTQVPERACQSMISSYDDDGDGRINFNEFVKLLEKSFY